jgi:hypothetical protein
MATTRKEPEYMELTKETKEKEPPHIYELDVPKVPQSTDPAEDKKDQVSLQYHYVKNTDTRGIKAPIAAAPSEPVVQEEEREKKKELHQYHYIEGAEATRGARPLSKLASQEVRGKIKETLEEKIRDRDQRGQRKCSVKCMVFAVFFVLTVLNTLLATAALAIGGILYSKVGNIQIQINNNYTHSYIDL